MKEADCYPGKRVGRLTLISRKRVSTEHYGNRWQWLCKCDCGRNREVLTFQLGTYSTRRGVQDCGNHSTENRSKAIKAVKPPLPPERLSDTNNRSPWRRLYVKWEDMIRRCYNPNIANYHNYGGRGIGVCDEWKNSYKAFKSWAISQGYDPNNRDRNQQSLDRIDVNDDYKPSNCRFVGNDVQQNNKTTNQFVTIDGETHTLMQWSKLKGISFPTIATRYHHGDRGKTLIRPVDQRYNWLNPKLVDFKGEKMTIPEIARRSGISQTTIRIRYAKGLHDDELVKKTNRTKPRSTKTA